ncbi:hypothetical protein PENSPDRAFT_661427 [Peniophora sp. CONT]|nr:hypothetical protein PENSPDRAFT_661427 [Peniophora sp. CONT]
MTCLPPCADVLAVTLPHPFSRVVRYGPGIWLPFLRHGGGYESAAFGIWVSGPLGTTYTCSNSVLAAMSSCKVVICDLGHLPTTPGVVRGTYSRSFVGRESMSLEPICAQPQNRCDARTTTVLPDPRHLVGSSLALCLVILVPVVDMSIGEQQLQTALARMAESDMRRWMENETTIACMLSCMNTVLTYGVRPTSKVIDSLPDEVILMILSIAGRFNRKARRALQAVCRRFRCLIVLEGQFYTDLASLPPVPAVFMDHIMRAFAQNRPFRLVLDNRNFLADTPSPHCLLTGIARCSVILIEHSISPFETVMALARAGVNNHIRDMRILSNDYTDRWHYSFSAGEPHAMNAVPTLSAPSLRVFHIRQSYIDLVHTTKLVEFLVDCGISKHPNWGLVRNAWPSAVLHATLARNPGLQLVDLRESVDETFYPLRTDLGVVHLPSLKHLSINSTNPRLSVWLIERISFPPSVYFSVYVGRSSTRPCEEAVAVARSMSYKLQGRTFNTLLVLDDKRSTSVMLSNGDRVWEQSHGTDEAGNLALVSRGRYLPQPGAVDFTVYWNKRPSEDDRVRWFDVLEWFYRAGVNISGVTSFEMRSVFKGNSLADKKVMRHLRGVVTLRVWPMSDADMKTIIWRMCSDDEIPWSVVSKVMADMFPGVRMIVDVGDKMVVRGDSVEGLLTNVLRMLQAQCD